MNENTQQSDRLTTVIEVMQGDDGRVLCAVMKLSGSENITISNTEKTGWERTWDTLKRSHKIVCHEAKSSIIETMLVSSGACTELEYINEILCKLKGRCITESAFQEEASKNNLYNSLEFTPEKITEMWGNGDTDLWRPAEVLKICLHRAKLLERAYRARVENEEI